MRKQFIENAIDLEGGDFKRGATGEDDNYDCFGLVVASLSHTLDIEKDQYPEFLRYPSGVIKFFHATKTLPRLGDMLFVENPDGETFHTLIYVGKEKFIHSTSKPDENGQQMGVVVEHLPQLLTGEFAVLSLERYKDYVLRHFDGTNINTIE